MKKATSFRLTDEALRLLALLASKLGISQSAALELAIRDYVKRSGVSDHSIDRRQ